MTIALTDWRTITNDREKYAAYLCSREWAEKREAVTERSGGICERCGVRRMNHCHHLTYERKYSERLTDLQAICKPCHDFTHAKIQQDPMENDPLIILGNPVKTVYLAGKFGKPDWRSSICGELSGTDGSINFTTHGKRIRVFGPKFVEFHHRDTGVGAHNAATHYANHGCEFATPRTACFIERRNELYWADLLFAWIDSETAYGTLVEIGMAFSNLVCSPRLQQKTSLRVIAFSSNSLLEDMWFAAAACDMVGVFDSASTAWHSMITERSSGYRSWNRVDDFVYRQNLSAYDEEIDEQERTP